MTWQDDPQRHDHTIKSVLRRSDEFGWEIELETCFWFGVPADSPVEPKVGSTITLFGKGDGYVVRGMLIDGQFVYYRTEAEEEQHRKEQSYGKDCADLIRKWDEGHAWSIELGGLGPGYEQCIQIMGFEMLRYLVDNNVVIDWDDETSVKTAYEAAEESIKPIISKLGVSGGQFGAARNLAAVFYRNGPIKAMEMAPDDRRIQVGPNFPSLAELRCATTSP